MPFEEGSVGIVYLCSTQHQLRRLGRVERSTSKVTDTYLLLVTIWELSWGCGCGLHFLSALDSPWGCLGFLTAWRLGSKKLSVFLSAGSRNGNRVTFAIHHWSSSQVYLDLRKSRARTVLYPNCGHLWSITVHHFISFYFYVRCLREGFILFVLFCLQVFPTIRKYWHRFIGDGLGVRLWSDSWGLWTDDHVSLSIMFLKDNFYQINKNKRVRYEKETSL